MNSLFDVTTVNGMTLGNRLARSATWEGMCDADGKPGPKLISFYHSATSPNAFKGTFPKILLKDLIGYMQKIK